MLFTFWSREMFSNKSMRRWKYYNILRENVLRIALKIALGKRKTQSTSGSLEIHAWTERRYVTDTCAATECVCVEVYSCARRQKTVTLSASDVRDPELEVERAFDCDESFIGFECVASWSLYAIESTFSEYMRGSIITRWSVAPNVTSLCSTAL